MHFSIPDTQELPNNDSAHNNTTYTGFNIYINGNYHCVMRFKKLHALHEQLRRHCQQLNLPLPSFPPKRLLPLTNGQLENRRAALEHYLQLLGQDVKIAKLDLFQNFLLQAQHDSAALATAPDLQQFWQNGVELQVLLMNGYQLQVNCKAGENSHMLLQQVCHQLNLPLHLVSYFCLYFMRKDEKDNVLLLRRLMNFESPYLSLQHAPPHCQLLLRKSYWNPTFDCQLLKHQIALNLLYIQTVSDVEQEWILSTPEQRTKLRRLQEHSMKSEYLELARQLPLYGCIQFASAIMDYPEPQTQAIISIGNRELSMRRHLNGGKISETKFRVTRMRCWRVTATHNTNANCNQTATTNNSHDVPSNLQLSFEYLLSKQTLRWISISSEQAMLMSVCLQAMVDELLNCKHPTDLCAKSTTTDDDSPSCSSSNSRHSILQAAQTNISASSSSSSSSLHSNSMQQQQTSNCSPTAPIKFLAQRFGGKQNPKLYSNVSYSGVLYRNAEDSRQNVAFEGIGDDDL